MENLCAEFVPKQVIINWSLMIMVMWSHMSLLTVAKEFVLIPQHTTPSNATKEIDELYDVFVDIRARWKIEVWWQISNIKESIISWDQMVNLAFFCHVCRMWCSLGTSMQLVVMWLKRTVRTSGSSLTRLSSGWFRITWTLQWNSRLTVHMTSIVKYSNQSNTIML